MAGSIIQDGDIAMLQDKDKTSCAVVNARSVEKSHGSSSEHSMMKNETPANFNHTNKSPGDAEQTGDAATIQEGFRGKHDPFGNETGNDMQYKTMAWWQAGMVMIAETISLGILSLPSALATLGLIPGIIVLVALGCLATYTGYVIGQFKAKYPHVHSMADAGEVLAGPLGREILGAAQLLFYVFVMGSHILTFSIMMNAITDHGACTVAFMFVGFLLSLLLTLPRTLKNVSHFSVASFVSIGSAVLITMIGVSITRPGHGVIRYVPEDPQFYQAFLAVANMTFAYAGHVAFFSFMSELREPKDFPKSLALLQISDISMYILAAVVIYYYAGNEVASPAFNSASPVVGKVAYGVAMPTIVIAGVVNGHVAVKYMYVRLFRNDRTNIMHQKTLKAYTYWGLICLVLWAGAWIIAEVVPIFNDLLGLTSALFASLFTFGMPSCFWMHMNWKKKFENRSKAACFCLHCLIITLALILCVAGVYSSAKSIAENTSAARSKAFSCADNSRKVAME